MAIVSLGSAVGSDNTASTGIEIGPITISDANAYIIGAIGYDSTASIFGSLFWDSSGANSSFNTIGDVTVGGRWMRLMQLVNPSTGTHSVRVAYIAAGQGKVAIAQAYSGVDSTTPNSGLSTLGATSTGVVSTNIPSEAGDLVVSFLTIDNTQSTDVTAQNGGTISTHVTAGGAIIAMVASEMAGAATVQSGFSWSVSVAHSLTAVNLNAAAGGAATPVYARMRTMLGVGR